MGKLEVMAQAVEKPEVACEDQQQDGVPSDLNGEFATVVDTAEALKGLGT